MKIKKLSNDKLIELFQAVVRHWNYCPVECFCFQDFKEFADISRDEVAEEIISRMEPNNSLQR